jgi:phosphate uptake regulator
VVLQSEDAVEAFKAAILQDAERQIAAGAMPVDFAFALHEIANECCRMADHCTNIAEQVIYSLSGAIVRHTDAGWVEVRQ